MKKTLLLLLLLYVGFTSIQAQSIRLPNECKKNLNKNFKGWKLSQVPKDVSKYHKEKKFPFEPNLIKGDWNGDGRIDYAVLIEQSKLKNSLGEIIGERIFTVAFVRTQNGFKNFTLEGGDYIQVFKKGEKDYNYESGKDFIYKNDSIFVGAGECCGSSYVWKKNRFVGIVTSD